MDLQTLLITFIVLFIISLFFFHYHTHWRSPGLEIDMIHGPKWYPIIGNAIDLMVPLENIWHFFRRSARDFYPIYKLWVGNWAIVNVIHPDDAEILLSSTKNITKSLFYDFLRPWLREGLLTSTGTKWKSRRKILTPAFHLNNLHEYCGSIVDHTDKVVDTLRAEAKSGAIVKKVLPLVTAFTLNTICESAMGMTVVENDEQHSKYKKAVYDIGNSFYWRAVRPWLKNDWIFGLTSRGREQSKTLKTLHGFSAQIIEDRERYHRETGEKYLQDFSTTYGANVDTKNNEKTNRKRLAFLDLLIAASKKDQGINATGIQEEVDTFVFEGHDTTAMSLFFSILLLAEHKEIQTRLRNEINKMYKVCNGKVSVNSIQQCTYLEQCVKESLRLYPSVPVIGRKIEQDIQLKNAFVPKGTVVNIQIADIHRDPNYWPRPNVFDPDRFLPENIETRHPFSYVPFSGGPRNCIGQKFAMLELKIFLAGILHNFYLEPEEVTASVRIFPDLVLRSAHPAYVRFVPIEN